jgi:hypothetical protein
MAFDEIASRILAAERDAGSDRLSNWLKQQGRWFADQAYDVADADAELRALYFGLREAVEAWLWQPDEDGAQAPASVGADAGTDGLLASAAASEPAFTRPDETEGPDDQTAPQLDLTASDPDEEEHGSAAGEPSIAESIDILWQWVREWDASAKYAAAFDKSDPRGAGLDPAVRLWEWVHLVGLRLPADEAGQLRAFAQAAIGAQDADADAAGIYLVPPLPKAGYDGVNIGCEQTGSAGGVALMLASAQQMDWLAGHDPAVMAGYRTGALMPFDHKKRDHYHGVVTTKLNREPENSELVQLDELIRGVVPVPMPSEDSWWRSRLKQSEQTLTERLGDKVQVPQIGTPYLSLLDQDLIDNPGLLRISVADANGPPRGNVAWVLRAWSDHKHQQVRGRVVFVDE